MKFAIGQEKGDILIQHYRQLLNRGDRMGMI